MADLKVRRVVTTYKDDPFTVSEFFENEDEKLTQDNKDVPIEFVLGKVPLDCIDDISRPERYNPRRLKEHHRDDLLEQITSYGLIYPLVCTLEEGSKGEGATLFLVDGRHRFNALLELDPGLKTAYIAEAKRLHEARHGEESISEWRELADPDATLVSEARRRYFPERENGEKSAPLVPVKIYLSQVEVDRIGMAIFLNTGQKKLAGGEYVEKLAHQYNEALKELKLERKGTISESEIIDRVLVTQSKAKKSDILLAQHVAAVMNEESSAWFPIIGRWQGETWIGSRKHGPKKKPLTANNFLEFVSQIVSDDPLPAVNKAQRLRETQNVDRLGEIFSAKFRWPDDIPAPKNRYTATAVLCRSFFIKTLGQSLTDLYGSGEKLFREQGPDAATWGKLESGIARLREVLVKQATQKQIFEELRNRLAAEDPPVIGDARDELHRKIDQTRGKLWSDDTVVATLKPRLIDVLEGKVKE